MVVLAVTALVVTVAVLAYVAGRRTVPSDAPAGLANLPAELRRVTELVHDLELDRAEQFGALDARLRAAGEQTAVLADTTARLREALASTRVRGQWGERMADDVLRLAGFVENVNYRKQTRVAEGGVPDFTFLLPRGLELHMDVKFPLDNYVRFLEVLSDLDRRRYRDAFLRDVRARVKELAARAYLAADDTVDCLLLFIPNEQLYAFIHEHDTGLLDDAMRSRIVLCSPLTLFAVLAVVRQAVDNFVLERTSEEILDLLGAFTRQWEKFARQMDRMGQRLEGAQKEYEGLATTRRRMLERRLDQIEALRRRRALEPAAADLAALDDPEPARITPL